MEQKQKDIHFSDRRKEVNQAKAGKAKQVNKEGEQGRTLTEKVKLLTETAKCESMLGGVRGRGSNSPTYSICNELLIDFK